MADNINVTADADYNVSADEVTASSPARHVQRVKLAYSADGSETHATVDADGVLVNLGANNDVTVTGTVTANAGTNLNTSTLALEAGGNLAAAATSLAVVDDWDESDRAKVNPIVGQAGIAAGAGNVAATVPRVTLAADDPAVALLSILADNFAIVAFASTVNDVSLASSASSQQLLAANSGRIGLTLTNTDANAVYVYFGTTATATKFTVKIPADGYYEMPHPIYTGRIDAIWAADGSGSLIGTELEA